MSVHTDETQTSRNQYCHYNLNIHWLCSKCFPSSVRRVFPVCLTPEEQQGVHRRPSTPLLISVHSAEVPPPALALAKGRGSQLGMRDTSGTKWETEGAGTRPGQGVTQQRGKINPGQEIKWRRDWQRYQLNAKNRGARCSSSLLKHVDS